MTSVAKRLGLLLLLTVATASGLVLTAHRARGAGRGLLNENRQMMPVPQSIRSEINRLGQGFDGRVGIAVKSVDEGWSVGWKADELYPQQSVSKLWVSIAALDELDKGRLSLDQSVTLTPSDRTLFHEPIAQKVLAGLYTTTLADLMVRAITTSDNMANDKLMWSIGGPRAIRAMLRSKHLGAIRFSDGERVLQSRIAGLAWNPSYSAGNAFFEARDALPAEQRKHAFDSYVANPYDGAAPRAIVDALARLKRGELLSPVSTHYLLTIMSETNTGPNRLKGGLATGWVLYHKTGTGQVLGNAQAGYNDVGILTAPDGMSYAVAVMIKLTSSPLSVRMMLMNNVVKAVIAEHDRDYPHVQPGAAERPR